MKEGGYLRFFKIAHRAVDRANPVFELLLMRLMNRVTYYRAVDRANRAVDRAQHNPRGLLGVGDAQMSTHFFTMPDLKVICG